MTDTRSTARLPTSQHLMLDNGLAVTLVHSPLAAQTAVTIRVAAGSHDEPAPYPGVAHFLEHLFFLGGSTFTGEQRLMPFVQRHSGRVNASTRERDTYFFFELPSDTAEQGVARLCDMLLHPQFDIGSQQREREILHSEFQLWERDTDERCLAALSRALPAQHPLLQFHAGNRDTLPVEQQAFQRALKKFHQTFYRAGQMRLVIVGPQSLDKLQRIAKTYGHAFPASNHVQQPAPPSLLPIAAQTLTLQVEGGLSRLSFFFPLEKLPTGSINAFNFLSVWLEQDGGNGLLDQLRRQGTIESLRVNVLYHYADQALIAIDFFLSRPSPHACDMIIRLFFDWLNFFTAQDRWLTLQEEYHRLLHRQLICMSPLEQARYWAERLSPQDASTDDTDAELIAGLSATDISALRKIFEQLSPQRLIQILIRPDVDEKACVSDNDTADEISAYAFGDSPIVEWQLPPPNPFLTSSGAMRPLRSSAIASACFCFSSVLPQSYHQAALFLRWHHANLHPEQKRTYHTLSAALQPTISQAKQAGVEVRFENQGHQWLLTLIGLAEPLPDVFETVLGVISALPSKLCTQGAQHQQCDERRISGELLIRQLLHRLPEVVNSTASRSTHVALAHDATEHGPQALANIFTSSQWTGLALGLPASLKAEINACLPLIPGQPASSRTHVYSSSQQGYLWRNAAISSPECAVLLFCPLPVHDAATEAHWRLLAQCYQSAFFQRLRTELQLGYAVSCGFRQVGTQAGILFAVQSPHASAAEILSHIEAFLVIQRDELASLNHEEIKQRASALSNQLGNISAGFRAAADQLWQAFITARSDDLHLYLKDMRHALHTMDSPKLLASHDALQQAQGSWICLANASPPDERWH